MRYSKIVTNSLFYAAILLLPAIQSCMKEYESNSFTEAVKSQMGNNKNPTELSGSENGHLWTDLGLSVKWATCNVGATSPEDYGSYFAWSETSPKSNYNWNTLKYCIEGDSWENVKFSKYGSIDNKKILEMSDDAANANWKGNWRMPTEVEIQELIDKCTWTWTTQGGHDGFKITSNVNGNSIFLPAAGGRDNSSYFEGSQGNYWSSSLYTYHSYYALSILFKSGDIQCTVSFRFHGHSIRPVCP